MENTITVKVPHRISGFFSFLLETKGLTEVFNTSTTPNQVDRAGYGYPQYSEVTGTNWSFPWYATGHFCHCLHFSLSSTICSGRSDWL